MVSRRILRVKVVQALYAFHNSGENNITKAEKELFLSIERIYDLYLMMLQLPGIMTQQAELRLEESKTKRLPTEEDLNPSLKFINNKLTAVLENHEKFNKEVKDRSLGWDLNQDEVRKIFKTFAESDAYKDYMSGESDESNDEAALWIRFYRRIIPEAEFLLSHIQEKSIYWSYDDIDIALGLVVKSLKAFEGKRFNVQPLYKDKKEDMAFVANLFKTTIKEDKEYQEMIAAQAKNWEVERIAYLDMLLMKMALVEVLNFKTIPVKVTLNEYIELSKWFSSPKSSVFINGILDKLVAILKKEDKIVKVGRGLIEK